MGHDTNSESESILSESNNLVKDIDVAVKTKRDEKPHKCTFDGCNLSFCRPSRLKRHMKFHTGEVMLAFYISLLYFNIYF